MRFATELAKMLPMLDPNCALAMIVPRVPLAMPNLREMKYATSEAGTMPLEYQVSN